MARPDLLLKYRLAGRRTRPAPTLDELAGAAWARRLEGAARIEEDRRRYAGLALTAIVALLAHAGLLLPVFALWMNAKSEPVEAGQARMVQMSAAQWDQNRKLPDLPDAERPDPLETQKQDKQEKAPEAVPGQVVQLPPPVRQERPDDADYASEWDQKTDRETRARDPGRLSENVTRKRQLGVPDKRPVVSGDDGPNDAPPAEEVGKPAGPVGPGRALDGDTGTDRENGGGAPALAFEIPKQDQQSGLALTPKDDGNFVNREALRELQTEGDQYRLSLGRSAKEDGERAGDGRGDRNGQGLRGGTGGPGLPNLAQLTPSLKELERVTGAPANDFLPDVETDAETRLNAWRWKHATFFNRIADGIRRAWEGPELLQKEDPSGSVYGTQDLLTIVQVTIDQDGNLVDIAVQETSGAPFLDDEAIRSFRATAPFANPPVALFGGEERFTFTFGFNVSYTKTNIDLNWRPY